MRKLSLLCVTALLLCSMPASAEGTADPSGVSISLYGEFDTDVRWVYNSTYLSYRGSNGYGLMDVDGNQITADYYSDSFDMDYGYIIGTTANAGTINAKGLLDGDGNLLIPFQYGDVDVLSTQWALGLTLKDAAADNYDYSTWDDDYYLIDTVDIYWLPTDSIVGTLTREEFNDASAEGNVINIENRMTSEVTSYDSSFTALGTVSYISSGDYASYDYSIYKDNGQEGLVDAAGNIVLPASYKYINDSKRGCYVVSTGEKYGLIDLEGSVLIAPEYDRIVTNYDAPYYAEENTTSTYVFGGYVAVSNNDRLGYVTTDGTVTVEPSYAEDAVDLNGVSIFMTDLTGETKILAADGVLSDTPQGVETRNYAVDYSGGFLYKTLNDDYLEGLIDWHGNEILPCEYYDIDLSGDGNYLLVQKDYDAPYELYTVTYPSADGAAAVVTSQEGTDESTDGTEASTGTAGNALSSLISKMKNSSASVDTEEDSAQADETTAVDTASADTSSEDAGQTAGGDSASVKDSSIALIDNVISLLKTDPAGNAESIKAILSSVSAINSDNAALLSVIDSVITLLDQNAAGNAGTALTLLDTMKNLL